jgi:hypothetical protein
MTDTDPTRSDPQQQDPESSAAADAAPEEKPGAHAADEGPRTEDLDKDPAHEPGEEGVGRLKGG